MVNEKKETKKAALNCTRLVPRSCQDRIYYFHRFKRMSPIRHPYSANEKLLFRKFIKDDQDCYVALSDKILVRDYVARKIGGDYLAPLLYTTAHPETLLGLKTLKDTVVKPNYGSGMVKVFVDEPDIAEKHKLIACCSEWLAKDYSSAGYENLVHSANPQIMVEQRPGDEKATAIVYKFHMFNKQDGRFEYVLQVVSNRSDNQPLSTLFYVNNLDSSFYRRFDNGLDIRPDRAALEKALALSKKLASDFDYVRVDWYISQGDVCFSELDLTSGTGRMPLLKHGLDEMMSKVWLQENQSATLPDHQESALSSSKKW